MRPSAGVHFSHCKDNSGVSCGKPLARPPHDFTEFGEMVDCQSVTALGWDSQATWDHNDLLVGLPTGPITCSLWTKGHMTTVSVFWSGYLYRSSHEGTPSSVKPVAPPKPHLTDTQTSFSRPQASLDQPHFIQCSFWATQTGQSLLLGCSLSYPDGGAGAT